METYDQVLGHLLARCDEDAADVRKVLYGYDSSKTRTENAYYLGSSAFTKTMLDATIDVLKPYTSQFFPHATASIRSKMTARTKILVAEDIVSVLYSITPTQCRTCKTIYISTSAENTDANITCLLCNRRSHKECLKQYTIDNNAGVVFLCDPCLSKTETAHVLNTDNSPPISDESHLLTDTTDTSPQSEAGTPKPTVAESTEQYEEYAPDDEICSLYKENSCPHGLTGKRQIEGKPCPKKHPPKCHYFIGKYGSVGCRYSAKRCPYFHPTLCQNSEKLKICLNKTCTKYHISGTKRSLGDSQKYPHRDQQSHEVRPSSQHHTPSPPQMWNSPQSPPSHENHNNGGQEAFLTYLHQMKADMQSQMKQQAEMHQRMKADIETSVKDLIRESMIRKLPTEQLRPFSQQTFENLQNIPPQTMTTVTANPQCQMPQTYQQYNQMYPMMIPAQT